MQLTVTNLLIIIDVMIFDYDYTNFLLCEIKFREGGFDFQSLYFQFASLSCVRPIDLFPFTFLCLNLAHCTLGTLFL